MVFFSTAAPESSTAGATDAASKPSALAVTEAAIQKEMATEAKTMRGLAIRQGLKWITGSVVQEVVQFGFTLISQALMCYQIYLTWKTLAPVSMGGSGCQTPGTKFSSEKVYFAFQLLCNTLITLAQAIVWLGTWFYTFRYMCVTGGSIPVRQALQDADDNMEQVYKAPVYAPPTYAAPVDAAEFTAAEGDGDDAYDAVDNKFHYLQPQQQDTIIKGNIAKGLKMFQALQSGVNVARGLLGITTTVVEPILNGIAAGGPAAAGGFAPAATVSTAAAPAFLSVVGTVGSNTTAPAAVARLLASSVEKPKLESQCLAIRSYGVAAGGLMASIGVWQHRYEDKYSRLVLLQKALTKMNKEKKQVSDEVLENELSHIVGEEGTRSIALMSGRSVPPGHSH
eukprot:TRINITY_DN12620_c0_g1_i2.p1 TRINITY_DN12620_c0_g1~~TRINITY_DN12620_c0_g1_i2.p1  ORF type:complete len:419 (-),score=63.78 TRINITY_DN12620_c0_g1_i2:293-1480(-)